MAQQFYNNLLSSGFKVNTFQEVSQAPFNINSKYVVFSQSDTDGIPFEDLVKNNRSTYLEWIVTSFDLKEDLDGWISCLFCGGHYTNVYIFKDGRDITSEYNFPHNPVDPEAVILTEEEINEILWDREE